MSLRPIAYSVVRPMKRAALMAAIVLTTTGNLRAGLAVVAENPAVTVVQGNAATAKVSLKLTNTSTTNISPMVFFATIQVLKGESSTGDVQISSVTVANDYIFRDATVSGIQRLSFQPEPPTFPTLAGTWFDAAEASESGVPITGGHSAGLFDLEFVLSPDAQGAFYIAIGSFGEDLESASSWSDGADPGTPLAFENAEVESTISQRTVARIDVIAVPEPSMAIPLLVVVGLATLARRRR